MDATGRSLPVVAAGKRLQVGVPYWRTFARSPGFGDENRDLGMKIVI